MGTASHRYRYLPDVAKPARNILWGVGALLAGAAIAGIVALFAFGSHGGSALTPAQVQPRPAAPAPPRGAVVLAQEAGTRAVALAVQRNALTATVLAPSGDPESGLKVSVRIAGPDLRARSCGSGSCRAARRRSESRSRPGLALRSSRARNA
jgi:hypothetical protein